MEKAPIPYEAPTITTYGTVRELTLGTGGAVELDILPCTPGTKRAGGPSGVTCKNGG
jgi:hypothetical protein